MPDRSCVYDFAPDAPVKKRSGGSFLGYIGRGVAFGIGIAVANAVFSPRTTQHQTVTASDDDAGSKCSVQFKAFQDCLNSSETDISKCQLYMDMLRDCRTNSNTNTNTNLPPSTPQN